MKLFWRTSFGLVLALATMATTASADTSLDNEVENYLEQNSGKWGEPATFRVFWKDGIRMESGDGNFTVHIRGRMYFDADWRDNDSDVDEEMRHNNIGLTSIRLGVEGTMYKNVIYKLELDFVDDDADPDSGGTLTRLADVYIGLKNVMKGELLFGHMKQGFSIGQMTSTRFTTFVARAPSVEAFAPTRNTGIQWFANFMSEDKLHVAVGIFSRSNVEGNATGQGGTGFNFRIAGLAIENADKDMILEIGFNFLWQNLRQNGRNVAYGTRPGLSMGPAALFVSSSSDVGDELRWGLEVAFRMGKLHMQGEFFSVTPNVDNGSDPTFTGWYIQIGYFITGESRGFSKKMMAWTRIHPQANFWTGEGGRGAHEIAFRFDSTDFSDEADEGKMLTYTFGWNWYWNSNARMMVNYVFADIQDGATSLTGNSDGTLNAVVIRWQFDF